MDAISRTVRRIGNDIRHLEHLDAYILAAVAIIIGILSIIGDSVSEGVKTGIILGALGLLVFNITVPEGQTTNLDTYLNDRSSFPPLQERLKGARKLWIYGASAVNILSPENSRAIKTEILDHPDGECRVLIQDPAQKEALAILTRQIDQGIDFQLQDLPNAIQQSLSILSKIKKWECEGTFDYGLLSYSPGFSLVVIDPHKSSGVVIVEFYGFYHEHTASRMNIEITKAESERWFTYWVSQFDYMWKQARNPDGTEIMRLEV